MELKDKVALITGAGSGIGEETAKLFARNGAKIVLSDINTENGNRVTKEINDQGGEAVFIKADVAQASASEESVSLALQKFGHLHIAVNNAGIGGPSLPIGEYDIEGWNSVIATNLSGVFYGMRYQIPAMLESGGGSIINVTSILGSVGFANSCAYVASKHGIIGLTKNGALEYASQNIRVNAVGPGFIKTPLLDDNLTAEQMQQVAGLHPIGRLGASEEVADLHLFLASDRSRFINGSYYPIDGGYLAQ